MSDIDTLLETIEERNAEIRRLHDEIFALRREGLHLAADLERAEKERDEARAEVDHWKGAAREHAINLADARGECDKLRHDLKLAEAKIVAWSSCLHCGFSRQWGDFWDHPCGQCEGHQ